MSTSLHSFQTELLKATRVLILCGAGLSASSGLPTFRGAGGLWKNYSATSLATPEAFSHDPGLVWQFYAYRRHMALDALPNAAHIALQKFAHEMRDEKGASSTCTVTQNVDGLSPRAGHTQNLHEIHGSLFTLKCTSPTCDFKQDNFADPLCDALDVSKLTPDTFATNYTPNIKAADLPHCPKCQQHALLRPGVVWFGESLPRDTMRRIDEWIARGKIDMMLVVGTTAEVYPAAGYVQEAREMGARIAVVNMNVDRLGSAGDLDEGQDWVFEGDAAVLLPRMLEPVIGKLGL